MDLDPLPPPRGLPVGLGELSARSFAAVLFDMDGTLIDSTPAVARSWLRWADEEGVERARLAGLHGIPASSITALLLADRDESGRAAALARINAIELDDVEGVVVMPGAAEALQRPRGDQFRQRPRQGAEGAGRDEQRERRQQQGAAAVGVGQLAHDRRRGGAGQQVGRDDPGEVAERVQLRGDGRHGGDDDGLIQRREQDAQHDAGDDLDDLRVGVGRHGVGGARRVHRCGIAGSAPPRQPRRRASTAGRRAVPDGKVPRLRTSQEGRRP